MSARYSQNRTDTRIDDGMRVAGNISFTGVLRIQGEILGNVACTADSSGTIVVGQSGHVMGALVAPHIVINGRVDGPAHSSESIEIHSGASLVGDSYYNTMAVHAGGAIDGLLIPGAAMQRDRFPRGPEVEPGPPAAPGQQAMPPADAVPDGSRLRQRSRRMRQFGGAACLLVLAVALLWVNRSPSPVVASDAEVALKASSSMNQSAAQQSAPAGGGGMQEGPASAAGDERSPAAGPAAPDNSPAPAPGAEPSAIDAERVVMVQGVNPLKPADVFSVTSKEPAVLFKKKRQEDSSGTRIDIAQGEKITIAIAKNEVLRVAEGSNLLIFYQGRKVSPKIIASGAWISFVPLAGGGASEQQ